MEKKTGRGQHPNSRANLKKGPEVKHRRKDLIGDYLKEFAFLTPTELASKLTVYAKQLKQLGKGDATMAEYISGSILMAVINEPDARLAALVFDRVDGKQAKEVKVSWRDTVTGLGVDPDSIRGRIVRAVASGIRPTDVGSGGGSPASN